MESNCSKHKKEILGCSDMKQLAEMVGDLHYETLAEFFDELALKIYKDSIKDEKSGKVSLANCLKDATKGITDAFLDISKAWEISKPFMK